MSGGFTWWVALESTYGPAKMGDFIVELDSSPGDVDRALQRTLGISLADSAALANAFPEQVSVSDPVCSFDGLPTLTWNDEPLVIDRGEAQCEDDDIISIEVARASWLVALEFPESQIIDVEVAVTVAAGDRSRKDFLMVDCNDELAYGPVSALSLGIGLPGEPGDVWHMSGRYVVSLIGTIEPDGGVLFPRAVFEEVLP